MGFETVFQNSVTIVIPNLAMYQYTLIEQSNDYNGVQYSNRAVITISALSPVVEYPIVVLVL